MQSNEEQSGSTAFQRSTDTGTTWGVDQNISPFFRESIGADITTNRQGVVFVSWLLTSPTDPSMFIFQIKRSTDGGVTFEDQPVPVATFTPPPEDHLPVPTWQFRVATFSFLAADLSSGTFSGRIYAVWQSFANGATHINLSFSANGGTTWSAPIRVDNSAANTQNFFPEITVSSDTGVVSVIYYTNRSDPMKIDVFRAQSTNGGQTFTNTRITDMSFNPNQGSATPRDFIGDYISIASRGGSNTYSVWTDARTGTLQIFGNS